MTHAWLFTGPPGSGRSNAARAFAAALQCAEFGGCGDCNSCVTPLSGAHPDVTLVRTEMRLSIGVDEVRDLVRRAAMTPTMGRYQVLVVEDADRVTERGADALLKSIEEPRRADGVAAVRAHRRRRRGDRPIALPAGGVEHPQRRRDRRHCCSGATGSIRASPPSRPGSPRATSDAPGRWPATRPPGSAGPRC